MAIVVGVTFKFGQGQISKHVQTHRLTARADLEGVGEKKGITTPTSAPFAMAGTQVSDASVVESQENDVVVTVEEPDSSPRSVVGAPAQSSVAVADSKSDMADIAALLSQKLDLADPKKRAEVVKEVQRLERLQMESTRQKAERLGIPLVIHEPGGKRIVLVGFDGDRPRYRADHNVNSAISIGTNLVRSTMPFNVTGSGMKLGLWEASGVPRVTHQEFGPGSRVTVVDGTSILSDHASHVAGTILGQGVSAPALGMAPEAVIDAYDSNNDNSEMIAAGAVTVGETGKIYISNHSYGVISGWRPESATWYGLFSDDGNPANDIEDGFGRYDSSSVVLDGLLYNLPYFLPFMSAGNDRNDGPPSTGGTWYLASGGSQAYDPAQHPASDTSYKAGYDLLDSEKSCKNVITIGATNDALSSGIRNPVVGTLADFSSTGPTDDGRIKPDVVANGVSLTSALSISDSAYGAYSGTSMATPSASGSALLLQQYFQQRFPGQAMRASTLKALIIHTADDIGRSGPDYEYGWGLMNTKAAAELIKAEADNLNRQQMTETVLNQGSTNLLSFRWDGVSPIRVTLCWTDPAGSGNSSHDNRVRDLVNDLNLKITAPNGSSHLPFVMPYVGDWTNANLTALATTGVNTVDNVEQVLIPSPSLFGEYVVTVDHTGTLSSESQAYSLIISGGTWSGGLLASPVEPLVAEGFLGGPFDPNLKTYTLTNNGAESFVWNAIADQPWVQVEPASGTLAAGAEVAVVVSLTGAVADLEMGAYEADVTFTQSLDDEVLLREVSLNVKGDAPQIVVQDAADQNLASGALISFGSHALDTNPVDQVFKIVNAVGGTTLDVVDVMMFGQDAEAFTVVSSPLGAKIDSTEAVPFVVRFSPRKAGVHSAGLYLYSNDPNQGVFHLALSASSTAVLGPEQEILVGSILPQRSDLGSFMMPVVASSGLPLTYTVLAGPATVDEVSGIITPTGAGAVTIQISQLGDGQYAAATPVTVTFVLTNSTYQFKQISTARASYHTLAVDLQGRLWSWGQGASGQLGYGGISTRYEPEIADATTVWDQVSAGTLHSLALKKDGSLWAWGSNLSGQVGDGTNTSKSSPLNIAAGRWICISAGSDHSMAIKEDGTLWAWGNNGSGRLGDGSTTNRNLPVKIGNDSDWQSVTAGSSHTLAIKKNGTLWAWGSGTSGQLGNGTSSSSSSPLQVGNATDWKAVAAGGGTCLAIKQNGTLWTWGFNGNGQLGNGTTSTQYNPAQIGSDSDWVSVAASFNHSAALKIDGSVWTWGRNYEAQIGNGNLINQLQPVKISRQGEAWSTLALGPTGGAGLLDSGVIMAWGDASGYTGKNVRQLTRAVEPENWANVSHTNAHTLLTKDDGSLWAFGYNIYGQIGNNNSISQDLIRIGSSNWSKIATGQNYSAGIQQNGSLWAWGYNLYGQIGDASTTTRHSPVPISTGSSWLEVALGASHTVAIRSDGTLWAWGLNTNSQLGDGGSANRSSPYQVSVETDWMKLAAGGSHTLALKTDGSLWATGYNLYGQLGVGDSSQRTTFTRVGSENDWAEIVTNSYTSFALKTDGSLWGWGLNTSGQLGLGNTTNRNVPTRVGVGNDWAQVSCGGAWTAAVKKDGTLWTWGNNVTYQQGVVIDGSISTPRQIGNSTGWKAVQAGNVSLVAMRVDGSLWTAGFAGNFRLTLGAGRSPLVIAPVLPALEPQSILPLPMGASSGRIQASSGLPVELEIISGSGSLEGDHFTHTGAMGSTTVFMAWQRGDETAWNAAIPTQFSITTQSIDFPVIAEQSCGTPLLLNASASSQLPVSYMITAGADIASLNGNTVTFSAPGLVTIQASQEGSASFATAEPVSRSFTVVKGSQIITFSPAVPTSVSYVSSVSLAATSDRELTPVTFSVISGPGIIEGSQLSFTTAGIVLVQAAQTGNEAFLSSSAQLEITALNIAPVAEVGAFLGDEDMTINGAVQAVDVENTPLTYTIVTDVQHGTLSLNTNGNFSYTPAANFYGEDSFAFKANDGLADSNTATITLTINAVNDAPLALAQSVTTPDSIPLVITLTGGDVETSDLEFNLVDIPLHGSLSGVAPNFIYTSLQGYSGPDSFTFVVKDGELTSVTATVSIQVSPVGLTFLSEPLPQTVSETEGATFEVTVTGSAPITYQWLKGGEPLPNQTGSALVLTDLIPDNSGLYAVRVTNPVETVTTAGVQLRVIGDTPEIQMQPQHQLAIVGEDLVMSVLALGKPPLSYQWKKNGKIIRSAIQSELRLPNVQLANAGAYTVTVTSTESDVSEEIQVGVVESPGRQVFVAEGGKTSWSFKTAGVGLELLWNHEGTPVPSRMVISSDGEKVSLKEAELGDAGAYVCTVTGPGGMVSAGAHELWVVNQGPDITPLKSGDVLPPTIIGEEYEYEVPVSADPQRVPSSFTVSGLPPGLMMDPILGVISGRVTGYKDGAYPVKITAKNAKGSDVVNVSLFVNPLPAGSVGTFVAPLTRHAFNDDLGGRLDLVTTLSGSFTGKLTLGARKVISFKGGLIHMSMESGSKPIGSIQIPLPPPQPPLQLAFTLNPETNSLEGNLTDGGVVLDIGGWRNAWNTKSNPANAYDGLYNLGFEPQVDLVEHEFPDSSGFASATVAITGTVKLVGKTADGETVTGSAFLGPQGQVLLHQLLYKSKIKGSLTGSLSIGRGLDDNNDQDNPINGALTWSRPAAAGRLYPDGFAPLSLQVLGQRYLPPISPFIVLDLENQPDNAAVRFQGGGIELSAINPDTTIQITSKHKVILPKAGTEQNPAGVTLKVNPKTGQISGGLALEDVGPPGSTRATKRKVTFQGLIHVGSEGLKGYGYFLLPQLPESWADPLNSTPIHSGRILLEAH